MRRLVQTSQQWSHNPPTFLHTKIIFEEDGRTYITRLEERFSNVNLPSSSQIAELKGEEIRLDLIWPWYHESLTIASNHTGLFLKKPNLLDVVEQSPELIQARILKEAQICELLKIRPHPHVVKYAGCLVEAGIVKGLLLEKYRETLQHWSERQQRVCDKERVLAEVEEGIKHFHKIGIVHGDIHPDNIMFDNDGNAVIIDLDSACFLGELLGQGHKNSMFFTNNASHALPENDYYSLGRLKAFLEGGMAEVIKRK